MNTSARNYHAHGGSEWVVGGKLTFLPGAEVEGVEGLFDLPTTELVQAPVVPFIPASEATTVAQLREDFNRLLTALKDAGIMAAPPEDTEQSTDTGPPYLNQEP